MSWLRKISIPKDNNDWRTSTILKEPLEGELINDMRGYAYFKHGISKSKYCGKIRGLDRMIPDIISGNIILEPIKPKISLSPIVDVEKCTRAMREISVDDEKMKQIAEKLEEMNKITEEINRIKREADEMVFFDNNKEIREGLLPYLRKCFRRDAVLQKMQSVFERRNQEKSSSMFNCFKK